MGTVRRHIYIDAPAEVVWGIVGAPDRLHEWFPIDSCEVVGSKRWINLPSGLRFEEDIITLDHDLRRFQYAIVNNMIVTHHLATVDVIADGADRCIVIYATDIEPEPMGLVIIGAAGSGLKKLQSMFSPVNGVS